MKEKSIEENNYPEWFKDIWIKTGGLIPPATAAKILKVPRSRINKIWQDKKLKKYTSSPNDNKPMLSLADVLMLEEGVYKDEKTPVIEYEDIEEGYTIKIIKHGLAKEDTTSDIEDMEKICSTLNKIHEILIFLKYEWATDKKQKKTLIPSMYKINQSIYYEVMAEIQKRKSAL